MATLRPTEPRFDTGAAPANATTLDKSERSATGELFAAAIGPVNAAYYSRIFGRFDSTDRAWLSWNWAACLCTLDWMVFRKLWGAALAYAGAVVASVLLLFGVGRLVYRTSAEMEMGLLAGLVVLAFAIPGLVGNGLLYAASKKRMARALAANTTLPEACSMLLQESSSRQRMMVVAAAQAGLLACAVAAYFALPQAGLMPLATSKMADARKVGPVPAMAADPSTSPASAPASAPASTLAASAPALAASSASVPAASAVAASAPAVAASAASAPVAAKAASAAASAARATSAPVAAARAASAPVAAARVASAPAAAARTASAPAPLAAADKKLLVNVGLFADDNNARNAYTKLGDAGLPATTEVLQTKNGKRTRVRAGPFDSRAEAERAADKIRNLGLDALVFEPKP